MKTPIRATDPVFDQHTGPTIAQLVAAGHLGTPRNAAGLTHTEKAAAVGVARPCSAHDVLAGGQCGNCLWKATT